MNVLRAFLAIDISPRIRGQLETVCQHLEIVLSGLPVRWVPVDNVHLTLKFLGDVSQTNLAHIHEAVSMAAALQKPFEMSVGGVGAFPSIHRPRVLWVGVETNDDCRALQRRIETDTARLGYAAEKHTFFPHLTLGRVHRTATLQEVKAIGKILGTVKQGFLGAARVTEIHLYKSDLKSSGAVYTKFFSVPLSGE